MSTVTKYILFVGRTFAGRNHDYAMLKDEFPNDQAWFDEVNVLADSGYQGMQSDYEGDITLPYKKPRTSKKNPEPTLSGEQKAHNTAVAQVRIYVENAIGGAKRYNILVHRFRNHRDGFDNEVIGIAAALWNFTLCY